MPILYKGSTRHILLLCEELNLKKPKFYYYSNVVIPPKIRGLDLVLIDEAISIEDIKKIKENNAQINVIGFSRLK